MNFKYISQWKVCNITFQNLDLESKKIDFNFDLSLIWEILEFGTKVLSRIRSPIFKQKVEFSHSVQRMVLKEGADKAWRVLERDGEF